MNHELSAFLCEAKKKTYANQSAKKLNPSREGAVDYEYSHGQMLYHDTYLAERVLWVKRLFIEMIKHRFGV